MASLKETLVETALKVRATEIVNLDESSVNELIGAIQRKGERDASTKVETNIEEVEEEEDDDDDEWSLYEDALEGLGNEESLDSSMDHIPSLAAIKC